MVTVHPQFITDNTGKKISVVIPIKEYEILMEELEELEDIKLYDAGKKSNEESFPIDVAFKMIEAKRANKFLK